MGQLWLLLLWSTVNIHIPGIFKTKQDLPTVCVKKHVPDWWGRTASSPAVAGLQCAHRAACSPFFFFSWHLTGTRPRLAERGKYNTNNPWEGRGFFFLLQLRFLISSSHIKLTTFRPGSQAKCLSWHLLAALSGKARPLCSQVRGVRETSEPFLERYQKLDSGGAISYM